MVDGQPSSRLRALADGVRVLEKTLDDERLSRDLAIFEEYQGGKGIRALERESGLSSSQVQRIIDQRTAAAQAVA